MADVNTTLGTTRLDRGRQTFERVIGSPAQGFLDAVGGMAPGYGEHILEWEFADAYNRPGLDLKTRELVVVAACAAIGGTGHGAVRMHVPAALRAGATRQEVIEVLIQVGFAAGLPASLGALQAAVEAMGSTSD